MTAPTGRAIRTSVLLAGLVVGLGGYSYGMFGTLFPSVADLSDVAHCGEVKAPPRGDETPSTFPDNDAQLCQVAPGKWIKSPYGNGPIWLALAILFGSTVVSLPRTQLLRSAAKSVWGHLVIGQAMFGVPLTLLSLHLNFVEGTLTPDWAAYIVLVGIIGGAVVGLLMWYTITRRLLARIAARRK